MANLMIMQLSTVSKMFNTRGTKYALFTVQDQDTKKVFEAGLTHRSLQDKGFNLGFLDSLQGCTIVTNSFVDRDGVINDPDVQIEKCNNGESRLVLLNSQNATVLKSALYIAESKDMAALVEAKVVTEQNREKDLEEIKKQAARLMARATKSIEPVSTPAKVLNLNEETESLDPDNEAVESEDIPF